MARRQLVLPIREGLGVDVVYACSGAQAAMDAGFDLVRPGSTIMLIGVSGSGVRLRTAPLHSRTIGLDALESGFEALATGEAAKVLANPAG